MKEAYGTINYACGERLAHLTLNRPQVLNAIDPRMRDEMASAIAAAAADPEVRVLILTGAGERAFCAGMDLRAFEAQAAGLTPLQARHGRRAGHHPLATFHKPIIGAINGLAYGGGLELSLLCDIVIAAEHATFAAAEVTRGLIPGNGATQRLPRKIGLAHAMEMLLTGAPVDAKKALGIGLVNEVVPAGSLADAALRLGTIISASGPIAVQMVKEAVKRGLDMPLGEGLQLESDLLAHVHGTEDAKEGVRAFIEKRPPLWKGQ
jgi:enoyl-CoA hydratase/carnithine racemase